MNFQMLTKIIFSNGAVSSLKEIIDNNIKTNRNLIVTDKVLIKTESFKNIIARFDNLEIFDEIEQNPKSDTINKAGDIARKIKPDLIIAFGGGSSIDAGKAIALLSTNKGSIEEYEGEEKYSNDPLPVIAIPTTCGTGSEVTWVSVITDSKRKFKMGIKGTEMFPKIAIIDPDLLLTLPKSIIASTGLDALTHAIEAYTSKPATPITDIFALRAIELISNSLQDAYNDIQANKKARESIMLGSTLAGIAFGNSDVGAVHCLSESIGALFDVSHGIANSIFLPYVMEFNLPSCKNRYAYIAKTMGIKDSNNKNLAETLIQEIKLLSKSLNIPSLKDIKIDDSQFDLIAKYSYKNNSNLSNPRKVTIKDYLNILNDALHN